MRNLSACAFALSIHRLNVAVPPLLVPCLWGVGCVDVSAVCVSRHGIPPGVFCLFVFVGSDGYVEAQVCAIGFTARGSS